MKIIKIAGVVLAIAVMSMATQAHADFTVELKNDVGTVIKTYTVTTNEVAHLQKRAARDGVSVITQFGKGLENLISSAQAENRAYWLRENAATIEEQSRQP